MSSNGGMASNAHRASAPVVLCVDDERTGLMVRRMLLEHHGYRVLTAEGGLEAIALFQKHPVELVVLDYSMPGMNGGDVATELRKHNPEVPILLLSAYVSMPDDVLQKVDRYLVKGDGASALLAEVDRLISREDQASA